MKLTDKAAAATTSVILFGASLSGKTRLAAELAEHFKIIYIDIENGYETLLTLPPAWLENIEIVTLPDTTSYPIAIETCLKMVKGPVDICDTHGKVKCGMCKKAAASFSHIDLNSLGPDTVVIFDSLTQISSSAIAHITKTESDDYKPEWDDWGSLGKLLDIFLSHIQQAKYNVVVISHESEVELENKKKKIVPAGGTRNFSKKISKYFSHTVYSEVKNKKHTFGSSTDYLPNVLTGSRTNISVEKMDKPSLLPFFKPELYPELHTPGGKTTSKAVTTTSLNTATKTNPQLPGGATPTNPKDILNRLKSK